MKKRLYLIIIVAFVISCAKEDLCDCEAVVYERPTRRDVWTETHREDVNACKDVILNMWDLTLLDGDKWYAKKVIECK